MMEKPVELQTSKPASWLLVVLALSLGWLANYLFYDQPLGISFPIYVGLSLAALYGLAFAHRDRLAWRNTWLAVVLFFFSLMVAIRADPFTILLNIGATFILTILLAYSFYGMNLLELGISGYITGLISSFFEIILFRPLAAIVESGRSAKDYSSPRLASVLRGLALAVPVLLVFTVLLSAADAAFEDLVQNSMEWLYLDDLPELTNRVLITVLVAWGMLGGFTYALRTVNKDGSASSRLNLRAPFGITEAAIVLGSVDLLFVVFVVLQFRYFFGGQANIHVAGFTYAEYARRGFAELVAVAVLSLGLVLILQYLTNRGTNRSKMVFEILAGLLALLSGVMLVSAFQRLLLYEQAYGFTELRFLTHVFMVWMGVLLVVFLVSLHFNQPRWFAFGLLLVGLGFITSVNVLNMDAFIARQNIARYESSGNLDAAYLSSLSDDAIPVLMRALEQVGPDEKVMLGAALFDRLGQLEKNDTDAGWMAWNYARNRAFSLLMQAKSELEQYQPQDMDLDVPVE